MALDIAALALLAGLAFVGARLGAWLNLIATVGLAAAVAVGILIRSQTDGPAELPMPALALTLLIWLASHLTIWLLMRRRATNRSLTGGALGALQAAAVQVLLIGAVGTMLPQGAVAGAQTYSAVAAAGDRVKDALPEAGLVYPEPPESDAPNSADDRPPRPIDWAEVEPLVIAPIRHLTGTVRAADRAELGFEVDGRVAEVHVEIGDRFSAGDVLAALETTTLRIALNEAEAALLETEAVDAEAKLDFDRQRTLYERGVVSASARDAARATFESARSRLAVARTQVEDARERLADAELIAPYDGQVAERLIEPAQLYNPGEAAFEVQSSQAGYEVDVTVPDTVVARTTIGTEHGARLLDGSGTTFRLALSEIGSRATRTSGFPVTFAVLDDPAPLRAGMSAEVGLRLNPAETDTDLMTIPLSAVSVGDGDDRRVFVYDHASGTVAERLVRMRRAENGHALIAAGLSPGEIVATAGLAFLEDGMAVDLVGIGIARYDR